ncbi:MAG: DUF6982 domain-containing protein [Bryobacteraceae bacterium]
MPASTTKKVCVQRFDREPLTGFVNPQTFLAVEGVELLSPSGEFAIIPYRDIKMVSFVREFDSPEAEPDRKVFSTRPKTTGLWVRMFMKDGDLLDGILSNDLLQLQPAGFTVVPPDASGNHQKLFIPRAALSAIQVLGVVGSPLTRRKKPAPVPEEQIGLFDDEEPGGVPSN